MPRILAVLLVLAVVLWACSEDEAGTTMTIPEKTAVTEALQGQIDEALIEKGAELFMRKKCFSCHKVKGETSLLGPNLADIGARMDVATLEAWIRHPKRMKPGTLMPAFDGGDDQLIALIAWLRTL